MKEDFPGNALKIFCFLLLLSKIRVCQAHKATNETDKLDWF